MIPAPAHRNRSGRILKTLPLSRPSLKTPNTGGVPCPSNRSQNGSGDPAVIKLAPVSHVPYLIGAYLSSPRPQHPAPASISGESMLTLIFILMTTSAAFAKDGEDGSCPGYGNSCKGGKEGENGGGDGGDGGKCPGANNNCDGGDGGSGPDGGDGGKGGTCGGAGNECRGGNGGSWREPQPSAW